MFIHFDGKFINLDFVQSIEVISERDVSGTSYGVYLMGADGFIAVELFDTLAEADHRMGTLTSIMLEKS